MNQNVDNAIGGYEDSHLVNAKPSARQIKDRARDAKTAKLSVDDEILGLLKARVKYATECVSAVKGAEKYEAWVYKLRLYRESLQHMTAIKTFNTKTLVAPKVPPRAVMDFS